MAESPAGLVKKTRRPRVPYKQREYFSDNLALLLKAGVPIGQIIDSMIESAHGKALKKVLTTMQQDISNGRNLTDTLENSGMVSRQTIALVRLGEASGNLTENLQLAAQQEAKRHVFAAKLRSAMLYPVFVLGLTFVVSLAVAWFLLPRLATTFAQLNVPVPPLSRVLINFGVFLKSYGFIAVPVIVGAVFLAGYILFQAPRTSVIGRTALLYVPGIGRLIRETETAQFGYLLGTLMQAGLSITESLRLLTSATAVPQYQKLYQYLSTSIDAGYGFQESLQKYPPSKRILAPAVRQMVAAGESSGSLPDVLMSIGHTFEQKSDLTTENIETIIEPILLVLIGFGVLFVAVAVILPIYGLIGGLNQ